MDMYGMTSAAVFADRIRRRESLSATRLRRCSAVLTAESKHTLSDGKLFSPGLVTDGGYGETE